MTDSKQTALIIDDEPDLLSLMSISLQKLSVNVVKAENVAEAIDKLESNEFDLCLTDLRLPDGNGLEIVNYINQKNLNIPVAVITAFGDAETAVSALKAGAFDYVSKPVEIDQLDILVHSALKQHNDANHDTPGDRSVSDTTNQPKEESPFQLIGESEAIQEIRILIDKVSGNLAPVHISGETGTGKELIARMIHQQSPRADGPFIAVNCGAIPAELMESEFFGHKKGSFTGAIADKQGLIQAASGGTLFLDEVADLPLNLQVKLLRVIQEKQVRPVGAVAEFQTNFRLISATHKTLQVLLQSNEFREDFYYRINVIEIVAPPLRHRKQDIPALTQHLLKTIQSSRYATIDIEPAAVEKLMDHSYPGNVRELENLLERAVALKSKDTLTTEDIQFPQQKDNTTPEYLERLNLKNEPGNTMEAQVKSLQKSQIESALKQTKGNITAAAKLLGISFRSLRYRIKKFNIDRNALD